MTPEQILKKAIEKAYENGWGKGVDYQKLSWTIAHDVVFMDYWYWYSIIFSHDFAKAFWGEKQPLHKDYKCLHCGVDTAYQPSFKSGCNHIYYPESCEICIAKTRDWEYYLQQMVLEKEPLLYLKRFLDEKS